MKKIVIFIFALLLLVSCIPKQNSDIDTNASEVLTEEKIWSTIENKEWTSLKSKWPLGCGIYFYTENKTKYAVSMTFGSGVAVISAHKSQVKQKDNKIYFDMPLHLIKNQQITNNTAEAMLEYIDGVLIYEDIKYELNPERPNFFYNEWIRSNR